MRICVYGLWHLGCVTAASLAELGFSVTGLDEDQGVVENLSQGKAPLFEPELDTLIRRGLDSGKLRFTSDIAHACEETDLLWITFDTPVNERDEADVGFVQDRLREAMGFLPRQSLIIISSQVPVGFSRDQEAYIAQQHPEQDIRIAYSPENLRLGRALQVFRNPDRIVIGVRRKEDIERFNPIFSTISHRLEWMATESAEMTKHAINAFLATSVVFANELALLCEKSGADPREVERGLKTEERIGPKAYLKAGSAFAGGTLARDIVFLKELGQKHRVETVLFPAVWQSNEAHKNWIRGKCQEVCGSLRGKKISILGLTYKPNTDTLRRSTAVELCRWLSSEGAIVMAYDPMIRELPEGLNKEIRLSGDLQEAIRYADTLVLATEHPQFRNTKEAWPTVNGKVIIDPNGFLRDLIPGTNTYLFVGGTTREA